MSLLMWTDDFALSFWLVWWLVLELPFFDWPVSVTVQKFPMLLMNPLLGIMMYFFCCLSVLSFSIGFASVRKFNTRADVFGVGPPLLFPVGFAGLFVGLFCSSAAISFRVNLFGRPIVASSLNIGCCGAFGCSLSKKRRQVPDLFSVL